MKLCDKTLVIIIWNFYVENNLYLLVHCITFSYNFLYRNAYYTAVKYLKMVGIPWIIDS